MDKIRTSEQVNSYLRSIGFWIEPEIVRHVVESLTGDSRRSLYSLYSKVTEKDGTVKPPICAKGTAYKIKNAFEDGDLRPLLEFWDVSTDSRWTNKPRGPLIVTGKSSMEDRSLLIHSYDIMTVPFNIVFSLVNRGPEVVDHFQLHVWLHSNLNWYPEHRDFGPWRPTGESDLPEEVRGWPDAERYYRETIQWTPHNGFLMPEGDHPIALHPLTVSCRRFTGNLPVPWKLEAPGLEPQSGTLLLRCKDGTLASEMLYAPLNRDYINESDRRFFGRELWERIQTQQAQRKGLDMALRNRQV